MISSQVYNSQMQLQKKPCSECQSNEFYIADNPVVICNLKDNKIQHTKGHPMGMVVCAQCGKASFYSLTVLKNGT